MVVSEPTAVAVVLKFKLSILLSNSIVAPFTGQHKLNLTVEAVEFLLSLTLLNESSAGSGWHELASTVQGSHVPNMLLFTK